MKRTTLFTTHTTVSGCRGTQAKIKAKVLAMYCAPKIQLITDIPAAFASTLLVDQDLSVATMTSTFAPNVPSNEQ